MAMVPVMALFPALVAPAASAVGAGGGGQAEGQAAEQGGGDGPADVFFNFATPVSGTYPLPDTRSTVVKFRLNDPDAAASERQRLDAAKAAAIASRSAFA